MEYYPIILGIIILDSISLGFIIYIFRIFPSYRKLLKAGVILRDKPCNFMPYFSKGHGYFRELILTKTYLILRNSILTSAGNIEVSEIKQYQMKEVGKKRYKISLFLIFNSEKCKLSFKTNLFKEWKNVLTEMKIEERT